MKKSIAIIFTLMVLKIWAQEQVYFNNIYQNNNNFAIGTTILETTGGYIGSGGTEDPDNIGQMLLLYKTDLNGNVLTWKPFGENYHSYYCGNIGGTMIKTNDGNFALAYHAQYDGIGYSSFIKFDINLDTIWKKDYTTSNLWTLTMNCALTYDGGYILSGSVKPASGDLWDILLLKTDYNGNMQWYKTYGSGLQEQGANAIQTPDGGYIIGGFKWDPAIYHSMDAMVIKTDSLGNEEWTKYYGNPDVDDDMALVTMADDGNYLVATVYGEWIHTPMIRTGRVCLIKIDNNGNTIWDKKIGPKRRSINIKNIRNTPSGDLIATGWSYTDTISEWIYDGWIHKFSEEGDSIWWRDYYHYHNQYDRNFFYDVSPTSDNGYIAIGKTRPDMGGENNMWIVKMDSMGCDTPGCFTTAIPELSPSMRGQGEELKIWPNPTNGKFKVRSSEFSVLGLGLGEQK